MALADKPLTSLQSVIFTTGPFVFFWSTLRGYISRNGPLSFAKTLTQINNQIYALFSLGLAYLILNDVFQFQDIPNIKTSDLAYVYHLSKFYEYLEVLLLVASGTEIGPHMAFRQLSMPFLTYFRVLNASDWQLFACLNCFHHLWMYAYFGGASSFRPILPVTGWIQLGAGIALDLFYCVSKGREAPETTNRAVSIMLLARLAMLFYEELKGGTAKAGNKVEPKDVKKKQ